MDWQECCTNSCRMLCAAAVICFAINSCNHANVEIEKVRRATHAEVRSAD